MKSSGRSALVLALMVAGLVRGQERATGVTTFEPAHLERALAIHRRALVLDTHSDVTPKLEEASWDFSARHADGHMDIPRLRDAGFGAQFFSVYMGQTPGDGRAIKTALGRIDALHEAVRRHPEQLAMAATAADVRRIRKSGRIACLLGIEGGHIIEDSLPALRMFYRLGCRYMTLTHSFNTTWADSAGIEDGAPGEHGGLTDRGREIVREMNRLGMMVDISHVARSTFRDALAASSAPMIASHSSCRALCDHRRNLDDEQIRALAAKGGVVQINFFSGFIDPEWSKTKAAWEAEHREVLGPLAVKFKANRRAYEDAVRDFERNHPMPRTPLVVLARHVEHVAALVGWRHVGIGADWDGIPALPAEIDHCGDLPRLTALLLARGASESDLVGYLGENLLRVLEACEAVAAH